MDPRTNHSSSSSTPRKKTRFVVRRGSVPSAREKRMEGGAKSERVPVPVRSGCSHVRQTGSGISSLPCCPRRELVQRGAGGQLRPTTHADLPSLHDVANHIEVLTLLVLRQCLRRAIEMLFWRAVAIRAGGLFRDLAHGGGMR